MTPRQIELVQSSFAQVAPIADTAAALFYDRLFTLDPALRKLFRGDMRQQGAKLMQMIAAAVRGLNDVPKLLPVLRSLGQRHGGYGVTPRDYDTVAQALMWTLGQGLQGGFTAEVRSAWEAFYGVAACTMLDSVETARA
jgi:hemoglobin-like flavoprotein